MKYPRTKKRLQELAGITEGMKLPQFVKKYRKQLINHLEDQGYRGAKKWSDNDLMDYIDADEYLTQYAIHNGVDRSELNLGGAF